MVKRYRAAIDDESLPNTHARTNTAHDLQAIRLSIGNVRSGYRGRRDMQSGRAAPAAPAAVVQDFKGVSDMATVSKGSGRDQAKELRTRIDDNLSALARAVDDVRASDTFKQYLDVQAKFHRYSWYNSLLIAMQRPEASQVAGYRAWQKLGRQVCKGERGITIFAPCP